MRTTHYKVIGVWMTGNPTDVLHDDIATLHEAKKVAKEWLAAQAMAEVKIVCVVTNTTTVLQWKKAP